MIPLVSLAALLWEEDAQRLRIGLKLFPACLGALESFPASATRAGAWQVVVVHRDDPDTAREAREALAALGSVRGLPLSARVAEAEELEALEEAAVSAVFVVSLGLESEHLKDWSERYGVMVFSPFAGDVERGAVAGISIGERIQPAVNLTQAARAALVFKPFFLRVARQHE